MSSKRPSAGKTTIYDIARSTGASPSTVSAALSGTWRSRRIKESTALEIQRLAEEQGYTTNMQARGLRKARSGLVGMVLPAHFNRFFSSMSQIFESHVRARGMCPVVVSTLRDPAEERRTVETLISYAVDSLFIVGATDPDSLSDICAAVNLKHVNVDLPGRKAPSVISNNYNGARQLTREILTSMPRSSDPLRAKAYFIGGAQWDFATAERIRAFKDVIAEERGENADDLIRARSYNPDASATDVRELCEQVGGLPTGLFINSAFAFEGVLKYFSTLPPEAFNNIVVGCYDYDPFASFMHFPVIMVRQNVDRLIAEAFRIIESDVHGAPCLQIEPELIRPRTLSDSPGETFRAGPGSERGEGSRKTRAKKHKPREEAR
ncbi:MAG: LacI family DNA-binding transcriptional regulator [Bauldia sp.]|nr:LacI family DNA-binding transcriptional regulator [Bauldia sp.]